MVPEIKAQMPREEVPDAIVCSVGGGGLFSGIMQGVEGIGWQTKVLAVETVGADSLSQAVEKGELVKLNGKEVLGAICVLSKFVSCFSSR